MSSKSERGEVHGQQFDAAKNIQISLHLSTNPTDTAEAPVPSIDAMGPSQAVMRPNVHISPLPSISLTIGAEARIRQAPQGPHTDIEIEDPEHNSLAGKPQGADLRVGEAAQISQPQRRGRERPRARRASAATRWVQSGTRMDERAKVTPAPAEALDRATTRVTRREEHALQTEEVVIITDEDPKSKLASAGEVFDAATTGQTETVTTNHQQESDNTPMNEARAHFSQITKRHKIAATWIADTMGTNPQNISRFVHGNGKIDLNWLILATEQYLDHETIREDPDMQELHRMRSQVEEPKWLGIFSDPSLSAGNALELLRVSQLAYLKDLAAKTKTINANTLGKYELDRRAVAVPNLNKIIEASPLDPRGKPAQVVRQKNDGMKPWHVTDLQSANVGTIYNYAFVSLGATPGEVAKQMYLVKRTIAYFRDGASDVLRDDMIPPLFENLGITAESALGEVIKQKIADPKGKLSEALLQKVVDEGQLVFQEHFTHEKTNALSRRECEISAAVGSKTTVGGMLQALREKLGIEKPEFHDTGERRGNFEISDVTLNKIERGAQIPEVSTVARIIKQYTDWGIFHPIARMIIDAARRERFTWHNKG